MDYMCVFNCSDWHPSSYYPVPQTGMPVKDVRFMTPLPPDELFKGEERTMKDFLVGELPSCASAENREERDY